MRGSNTLFADIFELSPPPPKNRKGRCPELNAQRNECLIDRYFFYGKFFGYRYTLLIEKIAAEFFISQVTVPEVIGQNSSQLQKLRDAQPGREYFKKKWPHLSW